jgi:hypothetical protein
MGLGLAGFQKKVDSVSETFPLQVFRKGVQYKLKSTIDSDAGISVDNSSLNEANSV